MPAAASKAPVLVDIVLVIEVVDMIERSLNVEDVRSSVFVGERRPLDGPATVSSRCL